MTNFPSQKIIIEAILQGVIKAKQNFLFWTNNRLFLSHGPQKIITIHVAQEIALVQDAPEIFIDATVADILRCSLPDRSTYTKYMQDNKLTQGAFSITLDERCEHQNDNDSITKVIISVKNGVRNVKAEYTNEIERICKMLDRSIYTDSTLEYGIFTFYSDLSCTARKKLVKRIPALIKSFDVVVKNFPLLKSKFVSSDVKTIENSGEWLVGCYVVEPVD